MKVSLRSPSLADTNNTIDVEEAFLGVAYNEALVHQVVTTTMTNARSGTKAQKTRAEVSGGGIKPWRQKGTGRARAGTIRSPLWRTGGVTFAAKPKKYNQKLNKKMYNGAIRSILSELNRAERLIVVEALEVKQPKTRELVELLKGHLDQRVTLVTKEFDMNLFLASRNIKNLYMIDIELLDPVTLVGSDKVIITADALKGLEDILL